MECDYTPISRRVYGFMDDFNSKLQTHMSGKTSYWDIPLPAPDIPMGTIFIPSWTFSVVSVLSAPLWQEAACLRMPLFGIWAILWFKYITSLYKCKTSAQDRASALKCFKTRFFFRVGCLQMQFCLFLLQKGNFQLWCMYRGTFTNAISFPSSQHHTVTPCSFMQSLWSFCSSELIFWWS